MRTTLTLDDDVYETARKMAFEQRRPLGAVVSDLARTGAAAAPRKVNFGFARGRGWIADDFDETPQEWLDAIEEPIDPDER